MPPHRKALTVLCKCKWTPRHVSKMTKLTKQITLLIALTALLALGIAYPFLAGDYDRLATPISTMIQAFGIVGLA